VVIKARISVKMEGLFITFKRWILSGGEQAQEKNEETAMWYRVY